MGALYLTKQILSRGVNRVFSLTSPAFMQIYWNKRKRLHEKRVQLPEDWFGKPTWPLFHCFGAPIWPPWRHVKTLYRGHHVSFIFFEGVWFSSSSRYLLEALVGEYPHVTELYLFKSKEINSLGQQKSRRASIWLLFLRRKSVSKHVRVNVAWTQWFPMFLAVFTFSLSKSFKMNFPCLGNL